MPKFNDQDLNNWKNSEIWTDSLWLIDKRDASGKHSNFYHGNFVPQIPHQLILRYSKKGDIIFDPFTGSGTTAYEAEALDRNFIGIEIQENLTNLVQERLNKEGLTLKVFNGDSTQANTFDKIKNLLIDSAKTKVQLAILHPPYADIVKFSDLENDLSNTKNLKEFLSKFSLVVKNTIEILEKDRYLILVIGDKYSKGSWIPLGFYCMNEVQKLGLTLKSIVVKNMEGNSIKICQSSVLKQLVNFHYSFRS